MNAYICSRVYVGLKQIPVTSLLVCSCLISNTILDFKFLLKESKVGDFHQVLINACQFWVWNNDQPFNIFELKQGGESLSQEQNLLQSKFH